jgi:prephenate dehydrogenase
MLYESIECEVRVQSAEDHDLEMAESHALAYFVAKGFLDSGVALNTPNAPPSAQAIYRTVEAVQEDAAHLFATLHRENPYSKDARRRLLNALSEVDQVLNQPIPEGEQAHRETGLLRIDAPAEVPPQLQEARNIIDDIDQRIMRLLAQRAAVSLRASKAKVEVGREVRDPRREKSLLDQRALLAEELALEPSAVGEIFDAILRFSRKHQALNRAQAINPEES